jgi:hypothetical protein
MATDADKLGKTSWTVWCIVAWSWAVVSSPAVVYFMYKLVGVSAFVGTATAITGNFVSVRLGRLTMPIVKRLQERRDQRAKLVEELIRSMRMVKLMQWQTFWKERIRVLRELEMKELVRMRLLNAANSLVGALAALSVPVSIFAYYTLVEVSKTGARVPSTATMYVPSFAGTELIPCDCIHYTRLDRADAVELEHATISLHYVRIFEAELRSFN